ncbi:DUF2784 domain-containing protein [Haloglycomyces albus]|uniref:DUF2784 domain-containing protein n=1 Tax=Haloglycomyces albus TaxID=526067 RepID=UPI00046D2B98|nr:DUF2784 domain-containing protein [Haloglycomyces albus]
MDAALAADLVMYAHFAFLVYLVLGGFLAWKWPLAWFPHAAISMYALAIITWNFTCPLTPWEDNLRRQAGQEGLESGGFLGTYIEGVIYPAEYITPIRFAVAGVIAVSWLGAAILIHRRRARKRALSAS